MATADDLDEPLYSSSLGRREAGGPLRLLMASGMASKVEGKVDGPEIEKKNEIQLKCKLKLAFCGQTRLHWPHKNVQKIANI